MFSYTPPPPTGHPLRLMTLNSPIPHSSKVLWCNPSCLPRPTLHLSVHLNSISQVTTAFCFVRLTCQNSTDADTRHMVQADLAETWCHLTNCCRACAGRSCSDIFRLHQPITADLSSSQEGTWTWPSVGDLFKRQGGRRPLRWSERCVCISNGGNSPNGKE